MAPLAKRFDEIVESLPPDWTDLELDLRIEDKERYVDAAVALAQCNARPYDSGSWHWRLIVANGFGHAAGAETVHGVLRELDQAGIKGELRLCQQREGRSEVVQMWGRPESVRQEFARRRSL